MFPIRTKRRRGRRSARGVSLIEIMVVLGVLSLMVSTVIVGFGAGRSAEVSKSVNNLANTIRYGFDKARVTGMYYRLHIDMEQGTFTLQAADEAMYLPATDRDGKPYVPDERDLEEREERDKLAAEQYYRSVQSQVYEDEAGTGGDEFDPYAVQAGDVPRRRPPLFASFDDENALTGLKDPITLPDGLKIIYVRTAEDPEPFTAGDAADVVEADETDEEDEEARGAKPTGPALYFFPQGRTQLAHIQLKDENTEIEYTIKVQPLTGRVTISDELEDLVLPDDPTEDEDDLGRRMQRRSF